MKFGIVWEACAISKDDIRRLKSDARTLASWNVDYIKLEVCEACHGDVPKLHTIFTEFGRFLRETKRPIVYACFWPAHQVYRGIMVKQYQKYCFIGRRTCILCRKLILQKLIS